MDYNIFESNVEKIKGRGVQKTGLCPFHSDTKAPEQSVYKPYPNDFSALRRAVCFQIGRQLCPTAPIEPARVDHQNRLLPWGHNQTEFQDVHEKMAASAQLLDISGPR